MVASAQASRLLHVLKAAQEGGAEFVILDTAPHSENAALAVMHAADLVLIPCRPAILDVRAIGSTIDLSRLAEKTAAGRHADPGQDRTGIRAAREGQCRSAAALSAALLDSLPVDT